MFPLQEIYKIQIFCIIKSGFWEIASSEMYTIPLLSLAANSSETGGEEQSIVLMEDEREFRWHLEECYLMLMLIFSLAS